MNLVTEKSLKESTRPLIDREIIERIHKTIDRGDKVVIWPSSIQEKDVNDMINSGHDVRRVIESNTSNTYSGLQAKIKFNYWKKI